MGAGIAGAEAAGGATWAAGGATLGCAPEGTSESLREHPSKTGVVETSRPIITDAVRSLL